VVIQRLEEWGSAPVLPNLRWLVPMALSFGRGEACQSFIVDEQYSNEQLGGYVSAVETRTLSSE
jgi:hypothetical protein